MRARRGRGGRGPSGCAPRARLDAAAVTGIAVGAALGGRRGTVALLPVGLRALAGGAQVASPRRMWRPDSLGVVIAERALVAKRPDGTKADVGLRIGAPVRGPKVSRQDPWWCPVQFVGLGHDALKPIAGEDSMQALVLALRYAEDLATHMAKKQGLEVRWLDAEERIVFAESHAARKVFEAVHTLANIANEQLELLAALRALPKNLRPVERALQLAGVEPVTTKPRRTTKKAKAKRG